METNLEKAKRLVYDHAYAGGIELPKDGFLFKMIELAATPDPSNSINNDPHIPVVSGRSEQLPLEFIKWYSGMEQEKIIRAYERWQRESGNCH